MFCTLLIGGFLCTFNTVHLPRRLTCKLKTILNVVFSTSKDTIQFRMIAVTFEFRTLPQSRPTVNHLQDVKSVSRWFNNLTHVYLLLVEV